MPWNDWQFWLVTAAALAGAFIVVKPLLPARRGAKGACGSCGPAPVARAKRTQVTVGGRKPTS